MSKTKIVETFTGQSVSDFGTKLRNCAKLEFRKSGIGQFCAKWLLRMIAQIVVFFFAQNWCVHRNCNWICPDTDVDVETILKYVGTPFKLKSEIKNMEGYSSKELRDHFYITYTLFNGICLTKKVIHNLIAQQLVNLSHPIILQM